MQASATFKATGADAQVATIFGYEGNRMASSISASDTKGPNTAVVLGSEARIEIDAVWYTATSFRLVSTDGTVLEEYISEVNGRGMHYQAAALERLVAEGGSTAATLSRPPRGRDHGHARRDPRTDRPALPGRVSAARLAESGSVRTTAYNARVHDETDAPGDAPVRTDPGAGGR